MIFLVRATYVLFVLYNLWNAGRCYENKDYKGLGLSVGFAAIWMVLFLVNIVSM